MKSNLFFTLSLFVLTSQVFAVDMSRSEKSTDVYQTLADGSAKYVGKCLVHQDYENQKFVVEKTVVPYFEPNGNKRQTNQILRNVDPVLIQQALVLVQMDQMADVDDLTIEKISAQEGTHLDLFRLNIGVGGGNGIFLIFNRIETSGQVQYEEMAFVMDGDVNFCDEKVWQK
jgi:hypothetical protein